MEINEGSSSFTQIDENGPTKTETSEKTNEEIIATREPEQEPIQEPIPVESNDIQENCEDVPVAEGPSMPIEAISPSEPKDSVTIVVNEEATGDNNVPSSKEPISRRATFIPPPKKSKKPEISQPKTHSNTILNMVAFGFLLATAVQFANASLFLYRSYNLTCSLGFCITTMSLSLVSLFIFVIFLGTDMVKYRWLGTLQGKFWVAFRHILHQNKNILLVIIMFISVIIEAIHMARDLSSCNV